MHVLDRQRFRQSHIPVTLMFFQFPHLPRMFAVDTPETGKYSQHTRGEGDVVCGAVARKSHLATALAVGLHYRVGVVDRTVEQIKHVTTDDGCESHEPPINSETIRPESVNDQHRENTKQDSICETRESRNSP